MSIFVPTLAASSAEAKTSDTGTPHSNSAPESSGDGEEEDDSLVRMKTYYELPDVTAAKHSGRAPWYLHQERAKSTYLVGIAGGTASGKTSVCCEVHRRLDMPWVQILSMDNFYKTLTPQQLILAEEGNYNFDHPDAFDWNLLLRTLKDIKRGLAVQIPEYDFTTHSVTDEKTIMYGADVVLFEGILSLFKPEIVALLDLKVFVMTDADIRLIRRIKRDIAERGRTLESVIVQYQKTVKPSYDHFCAPTQSLADVIIPRGKSNTVAIDLLTTHIRNRLTARGIDTRPRSLIRLTTGISLPPNIFQLEITPEMKESLEQLHNEKCIGDALVYIVNTIATSVMTLTRERIRTAILSKTLSDKSNSPSRISSAGSLSATVPDPSSNMIPGGLRETSPMMGPAVRTTFVSPAVNLPRSSSKSKLIDSNMRKDLAEEYLDALMPTKLMLNDGPMGSVVESLHQAKIQSKKKGSSSRGVSFKKTVDYIPDNPQDVFSETTPSSSPKHPGQSISPPNAIPDHFSHTTPSPKKKRRRREHYCGVLLTNGGYIMENGLRSVFDPAHTLNGSINYHLDGEEDPQLTNADVQASETTASSSTTSTGDSSELNSPLRLKSPTGLPANELRASDPLPVVFNTPPKANKHSCMSSDGSEPESSTQTPFASHNSPNCSVTHHSYKFKLGGIHVQTHLKDPNNPRFYHRKLPVNVANHKVILVDALVGTGNRARMALHVLRDHHVPERNIYFVSLVANRRGLSSLARFFPKVTFVTGILDPKLDNDHWLTLPGIRSLVTRYCHATQLKLPKSTDFDT